MYCDSSITIMWSLNVFINNFPLTCLIVKKFCQAIRVRPAHKLKVLQLLPVAYPTLNLKSFSCHGKCQQQNVTLVGRCFVKCWGY